MDMLKKCSDEQRLKKANASKYNPVEKSQSVIEIPRPTLK
jgi:hypothetical protein